MCSGSSLHIETRLCCTAAHLVGTAWPKTTSAASGSPMMLASAAAMGVLSSTLHQGTGLTGWATQQSHWPAWTQPSTPSTAGRTCRVHVAIHAEGAAQNDQLCLQGKQADSSKAQWVHKHAGPLLLFCQKQCQRPAPALRRLRVPCCWQQLMGSRALRRMQLTMVLPSWGSSWKASARLVRGPRASTVTWPGSCRQVSTMNCAALASFFRPCRCSPSRVSLLLSCPAGQRGRSCSRHCGKPCQAPQGSYWPQQPSHSLPVILEAVTGRLCTCQDPPKSLGIADMLSTESASGRMLSQHLTA